MQNPKDLTKEQIRRIIAIKQQIEGLECEIGPIDADGFVWSQAGPGAPRLQRDHRPARRKFLMDVKKIIAKTERLIADAFNDRARIVCSPNILAQHAEAMRKLFVESHYCGPPPPECRNIERHLAEVTATADNVFVYAGRTLSQTPSGGWTIMLENELARYRVNLARLVRELEKVG